ncbi:MAG: DUF998 domain-containing protein [Microbacterium sp.]|nr:MAG: DUF998 domain-containing protein [Microbacterium sp.]
MTESPKTLDRGHAVTRSLLGWGVVAGPFYLVVSLILALTRPGFDLGRHALSLLMLGEWGWMQRTNFVLTGLMVIAAGFGLVRAIRSGRGLAMGVLVAVFGVALLLSAVFPPDAVDGFPPGATASATTSGILHLAFGALGFIALAAAAFAYASWCRAESTGAAWIGILLGALVVVGFVAGAVLARSPFGVALLWIAVLAGWLWLALASVRVYAWTPHPVTGERR